MNDPDPNFDPMKFMKAHRDAQSLSDFPQEELSRFEAKVSAIRHIEERFIKKKDNYPPFDPENLKNNSLWYYPEGHSYDYGFSQMRHSFDEWPNLKNATQLVIPASPILQREFALEKMLPDEQHQQLLWSLYAQPQYGYDPEEEPGKDALDLNIIDGQFFYTSGIEMYPIEDVWADISEPAHFQLAGITIRPHQMEGDIAFDQPERIPQVRFVYQLMNPRNLDQPFEQLFYHLNFDVADRDAPLSDRDEQIDYFIQRLNDLYEPKITTVLFDHYVADFLNEFSQEPAINVAFSSTLTGMWIFGALTRSNNLERELKPMRIVRQGIDLGYYSSSYDNDLFRQARDEATGVKKRRLEKQLEDLTVSHYRDPKRMDAHGINFHRMSCAQCHQMSGRDGIFFALNDGVDRRFQETSRAAEFIFHDVELQLKQLGH
jgi:hypothetical protein